MLSPSWATRPMREMSAAMALRAQPTTMAPVMCLFPLGAACLLGTAPGARHLRFFAYRPRRAAMRLYCFDSGNGFSQVSRISKVSEVNGVT